MNDTQVVVVGLRFCDICKHVERVEPGVAIVDGRTAHGGWAYMCERHYRTSGLGVGLGVGQELVYSDR